MGRKISDNSNSFEYNIPMKKILVLASSNENKVREIREMMPDGFEVLSMRDLNLHATKEETGNTFEENAKIKAEDIASMTDYPVFSDDSGLEIDALGGFPGIHSARFMEGHSYQEKCEEILHRLEGKENRKARFVTAMVYFDKKNGIEKTFFGVNEGKIISSYPKGEQNGFGYDPIFFSDDLMMTFGEADSVKKDEVSHRGRALREMIQYLIKENKR